MENLNHFVLKGDGSCDVNIGNNNCKTNEGVSVYFRDIEENLISHISEADAVFGAIAWLTNEAILNALSKVKNAIIIIQKEDFLRPDLGSNSGWKKVLRNGYSKLNNEITRYSFKNLLHLLSVASDPSIEPVRCVGNYNRDKKSIFPRMHNKFIIFAQTSKLNNNYRFYDEVINPYAVWTGSFNFTKNATKSLENALYITVPSIVEAYFKEFEQIAAISEPLDWTADWVEPEWRIGT